MPISTEKFGDSGRQYVIQRVLQQKDFPREKVYLATAEDQSYVLKEIPESHFDILVKIYDDLRGCPYLRLLEDASRKDSILIYKYFRSHLLSLAQKELPMMLTKRILRDVLHGIAALHSKDIVHTDIKANNIVIEWEEVQHQIQISQVQLTDIEDAAQVPPGCAIIGKEAGNWMWRSPEAHASGRVDKASDMFSFGIVCIYAVLRILVFAVDEEQLAEGEELLSVVLERQISYFADREGLDEFLNYLGDNPWRKVFEIIWDSFDETHPREPFSLWEDVDTDFRDLIGGLTNFDPAKRLTAHEAVAHKWFQD